MHLSSNDTAFNGGFFMLDTLPDLAREIIAGDTITVLDIAKQFDVSPSTAFRWMMKGLPDSRGERLRLQALRRGKIWLTSRAALERFLSGLPHSAPAPGLTIRTPSKRQSECARAKKSLNEKYGI
jgi:hypothetical protein